MRLVRDMVEFTAKALVRDYESSFYTESELRAAILWHCHFMTGRATRVSMSMATRLICESL